MPFKFTSKMCMADDQLLANTGAAVLNVCVLNTKY